jgi:hypothetical protein
MRQALTDLSAEQLLASPKPYIAMFICPARGNLLIYSPSESLSSGEIPFFVSHSATESDLSSIGCHSS